jgi:hypothetical protein
VKPENKGRWGCGAILGVAFFGIGLIVAPIQLMHPTTRLSDQALEGMAGIILLSATVVVWIVLYKVINAIKYNRSFRVWFRAQAKWDQLYYCNRCGSVFNPNEHGRFVPASRMKELLA